MTDKKIPVTILTYAHRPRVAAAPQPRPCAYDARPHVLRARIGRIHRTVVVGP